MGNTKQIMQFFHFIMLFLCINKITSETTDLDCQKTTENTGRVGGPCGGGYTSRSGTGSSSKKTLTRCWSKKRKLRVKKGYLRRGQCFVYKQGRRGKVRYRVSCGNLKCP